MPKPVYCEKCNSIPCVCAFKRASMYLEHQASDSLFNARRKDFEQNLTKMNTHDKVSVMRSVIYDFNSYPEEYKEQQMALDDMAQRQVDETMKTLQDRAADIVGEVRISARRMRALILFTQQRMQVNFGGKLITLVESTDAPDLDIAVEEACAITEEPEDDAPTPEELAELRALRASKKAAS